MEYTTIEIQGIDGLERHIRIATEDGGYITFPAVDSNPNYVQFKLDLAQEQK